MTTGKLGVPVPWGHTTPGLVPDLTGRGDRPGGMWCVVTRMCCGDGASQPNDGRAGTENGQTSPTERGFQSGVVGGRPWDRPAIAAESAEWTPNVARNGANVSDENAPSIWRAGPWEP